MCAQVCACTHMCARMSLHICTHKGVWVGMHGCVCICARVWVCVNGHACVCVFILCNPNALLYASVFKTQVLWGQSNLFSRVFGTASCRCGNLVIVCWGRWLGWWQICVLSRKSLLISFWNCCPVLNKWGFAFDFFFFFWIVGSVVYLVKLWMLQ